MLSAGRRGISLQTDNWFCSPEASWDVSPAAAEALIVCYSYFQTLCTGSLILLFFIILWFTPCKLQWNKPQVIILDYKFIIVFKLDYFILVSSILIIPVVVSFYLFITTLFLNVSMLFISNILPEGLLIIAHLFIWWLLLMLPCYLRRNICGVNISVTVVIYLYLEIYFFYK